MKHVEKPELSSQNKVTQLYQSELSYSVFGDWETELQTKSIFKETTKSVT